jgi:hypothetical protein
MVDVSTCQQICFLPMRSAGQSRKEKKYERWKACSHMSTVTHERNRVARHDQVGAAAARTDQAFYQSASSKWMSYEFCATQPSLKLVSSIEYGDDGSTKFPSAANDPLFNERLHEPLEPFLKLGGEVSLQERSLLHH